MVGTEGTAKRTEYCPYCKNGCLIKNTQTNRTTCDGCGAYFEKGILYRNTQDRSNVPGPQLFRIRKWQQRIRATNAAERNLAFALSELDRLAMSNSLPRSVKGNAATIYRKAIGKNLVRGRSIDSLVAASIYSACRIYGIPRTLDEIAETSKISKKELGRTYRFLARELKFNILPAKPQDYIVRYCDALNLPEKVRKHSKELLDEAAERDLVSGLGPSGLAAAAIYIGSHLENEGRSQREVATAADISEVTLRCRYKKLANELGITLEF